CRKRFTPAPRRDRLSSKPRRTCATPLAFRTTHWSSSSRSWTAMTRCRPSSSAATGGPSSTMARVARNTATTCSYVRLYRIGTVTTGSAERWLQNVGCANERRIASIPLHGGPNGIDIELRSSLHRSFVCRSLQRFLLGGRQAVAESEGGRRASRPYRQ